MKVLFQKDILSRLKHFLFRRVQESDNSQTTLGIFLEEMKKFSTKILDSSYKSVFERALCQAVGDVCQLRAELSSQAESWYDKIPSLKYSSGSDYGGLLGSVCKLLMFYSRGEKRRALEMCHEEFDKVFGSGSQAVHNAFLLSCPVSICSFETSRFQSVDPSLASALKLNLDLEAGEEFNPLSFLLFVAIRCERENTNQRFVEWIVASDIEFFSKVLSANHGLLLQVLVEDRQLDERLLHAKSKEQTEEPTGLCSIF